MGGTKSRKKKRDRERGGRKEEGRGEGCLQRASPTHVSKLQIKVAPRSRKKGNSVRPRISFYIKNIKISRSCRFQSIHASLRIDFFSFLARLSFLGMRSSSLRTSARKKFPFCKYVTYTIFALIV
jgi:hypothetical protein